jgi:hypothetical protein
MYGTQLSEWLTHVDTTVDFSGFIREMGVGAA